MSFDLLSGKMQQFTDVGQYCSLQQSAVICRKMLIYTAAQATEM
jgi:hypothetical protein